MRSCVQTLPPNLMLTAIITRRSPRNRRCRSSSLRLSGSSLRRSGSSHSRRSSSPRRRSSGPCRCHSRMPPPNPAPTRSPRRRCRRLCRPRHRRRAAVLARNPRPRFRWCRRAEPWGPSRRRWPMPVQLLLQAHARATLPTRARERVRAQLRRPRRPRRHDSAFCKVGLRWSRHRLRRRNRIRETAPGLRFPSSSCPTDATSAFRKSACQEDLEPEPHLESDPDSRRHGGFLAARPASAGTRRFLFEVDVSHYYFSGSDGPGDLFIGVFHKFDRDKSGEVDADEFAQILNWLSFPSDGADTILKDVDFDGSGQLNEKEFLECMRKIQYREIQAVKAEVKKGKEQGDGKIRIMELSAILGALNYTVDLEAVRDAAKSIVTDVTDDTELDLSDIWQIFMVYRWREGFCAAEVEAISQVFEMFVTSADGNLGSLELGPVLRRLGCPLPFDEQQHIVDQVDISGDGLIDVRGLRMIVRLYQTQLLDRALDLFADYSEYDAHGKQYVHVAKAKLILEQLELMSPEQPSKGLFGKLKKTTDNTVLLACYTDGKSPNVFVERFTAMVLKFSKSERRLRRINYGFSPRDVLQCKQAFKSYDLDNSGDIAQSELVHLLEKQFPDLANDASARPQLVKILKEVDSETPGCVNFDEYLRLMQQWNEMNDRKRIKKLHKVIELTGFSQDEVKGFRELFVLADIDKDGLLTPEDVHDLIEQTMPLSDAESAELHQLFLAAVSASSNGVLATLPPRDAPPKRDVICLARAAISAAGAGAARKASQQPTLQRNMDFPSFLSFMRLCVASNFARMNSRTAAIVERNNRRRGNERVVPRLSVAVQF
eukprot:TRINITY_DN24511_c0_g3_i1.p1 TRINITY_DN24511_c0_g3~~TRINITY_DN24511_c0_g3_i1.p1  ORF type:complete len:829 (+),score=117.84 TRINITY_DN24511_c0_g3_i1:889-3375(+)